MQNLPYFFLLLKKNIALWTLITTGSFSKIDTANTQYTRMSPYTLTLRNYSLSKNNTFKEIWIMSTGWQTSINFRTSDSKYMDSIKNYFGTSTISGSMEGGYTMNDTAVHNSTDMLGPIDIGLDRNVSVFLSRSGEHEYKIDLLLQAKNYMELKDRFMDSVRRADSVKYGIGPIMEGMPSRPKPSAARLLDSAMRTNMIDHRKLTDAENNQIVSRGIEILNKAIKTDSIYLEAYDLKFGWETELKRYESIIVTGKKILKLRSSDSAQVMYRIGECYELTGKIDSARIYYKNSLFLYDQQINKMSKNDIDKYDLSYKALILILLNREKEGRAIFKSLSEIKIMNKYERLMYHNYFITPRSEFLQKLNP